MQITVPYAMITSKAAAWGVREKELFKASQEALRYAVANHPEKEQLRTWLEQKVRLYLDVQFHLNARRVNQSDLDSLLSDLLNPLVEGACGPRPAGKPVPQTKDRLFWKAALSKIKNEDEKIVIDIQPLKQAG